MTVRTCDGLQYSGSHIPGKREERERERVVLMPTEMCDSAFDVLLVTLALCCLDALRVAANHGHLYRPVCGALAPSRDAPLHHWGGGLFRV